MCVKRSAAALSLLFLAIIRILAAANDNIDYGEEVLEKLPLNIPELYQLLLQRNVLANGLKSASLGHLMIRKSQRSPSLRLRFGRSDPHASIEASPIAVSAVTDLE